MFNEPHAGTPYQEFLARLTKERGTDIYLEVGVQNGVNLSGISATTAFGVDPDFMISTNIMRLKSELYLYQMTSDKFFSRHATDVLSRGALDMAFLDGMHCFEYLLRDFYNTERISKASGLITLHDCMPFDGEMIERVNSPSTRTSGSWSGAWTGDVWKIIPILKQWRPDLRVLLLNCYPTGLICISNLDPGSTVLKDRYFEIVDAFVRVPNRLASLEQLYSENEVIDATSLLAQHEYTLRFRIDA